MSADILDPTKVPERIRPMVAEGYRELAAHNRLLYAESLNGRRPHEQYRQNAELYESYIRDLEQPPIVFGKVTP